MSRIADALTSVAGRITAGAAVALTISVGLYPDHPRPIDPVRLGAVITAVLTWILAEIASGRKPSAHDVALFGKIIDLIPPATVDFLRNHNFDDAFHSDRQGGLHELADWDGSRYQFSDRVLQRRWKKVHRDIQNMSEALVRETGPIASTTLLTARRDVSTGEIAEDAAAHHVNELNRISSGLSKSMDGFEAYARGRLGL